MASIFVVGPIATLRNSSGAAQKAEPVTDPLIRLAQRAGVPIPSDPQKLVKLNAGIQLAAGLCLATGRMPRLSAAVLASSLVPTTLAGHDFWNETDPSARQQQQLQLAKNLSLLGGLLIAAGDTDGKPGAVWLAKHAARTAAMEGKIVALEADRGTAAIGATAGTALLAAAHHAKDAVKDAAHQAAASDTTHHLADRATEMASSIKESAQQKAPVVAAAAREHAATLAASAAAAPQDARAEAQPMVKDLRKKAGKKALKKSKKAHKAARKMAKKKGPALAAAARAQANAARAQATAVGELAKAKIA